MKNLAISLVTYNTSLDDLKKLLDSVSSTTLIYDFYVIDNSPTDDLKSFFQNYDKVIYRHTGENLGYGGGHNKAMEETSKEGYEYHLVVNPDVFFDSKALETAYNFMQQNPEVGHLGPKIFWPNNEMQYICRRQPRPYDLFCRRFLPRSLVKKRLDRYEMRETSYDKVIDVGFLPGSFMFMRTSALREVGLFDDRFFMYMEDVDLTRRISEKYRTVFHPDVVIFHERATAHRRNKKLLFIFIQSVFRFYNKHGWLPIS